MNELRIEDVSFFYGKRCILEHAGFHASSGEITLLLGANGAGKSTLIKCVNGLLTPKTGRVFWKDRETEHAPLKERARIYGYVPQNTQAGAGLTVMETVLSGRLPYMGARAGKQDVERAAFLVEQFGLKQMAFRQMGRLSGGERQRALIARAMAGEPEVLLLDEPTSSLDLRYQYEIMEMLYTLSRNQKTAVVAVIHDLNLAMDFGDRGVLLFQGHTIAEGAPREVMTEETIARAYGIEVKIGQMDGRSLVMPRLQRKLTGGRYCETPQGR